MVTDRERRFSLGAFMLASVAAPAASFVLWSAWSLAKTGPAPSEIVDMIVGGLLFLLLVTAWGMLPAAVFGAILLLPLERFWPRPPDAWVLGPAGLVAAGVYVAVSLRMMAVPGVMLFAPWVAGRLGADDMTGHPLTPIATCIVLSGGVAALVYARICGRWRMPRSGSEAPRGER